MLLAFRDDASFFAVGQALVFTIRQSSAVLPVLSPMARRCFMFHVFRRAPSESVDIL